MSANRLSSPLRRRGAWNLPLVLFLIAGSALLTTATGWTQAPKPDPDLIVFTNGDQLTGTLERATGDSFVFKSDIVGEVTVSADKIKELRSHGAFVALKKDQLVKRVPLPSGPVTYADSVVSVAPSSSAEETVPVKDLSFLIDDATFKKEVLSNPGFLHGWSGGVSGGVTLTQATDYGETFSLAVNLIRAIPSVAFLPPRTRSTVNVLETYGKLTSPTIPQTFPIPTPDSVAKTSIFHADAEHDKYLNSRLYLLGDVSFDHNYSQGLDLQQIYGVGAGYTVFSTPKQGLDVKADIHYERQNFVPPNVNEDLIGSSFAEDYHRNLPGKIVFTENGTFIPAWNDLSIYSAIFGAGLQLPTYKRFSINVNVQDNYLSNPAVGYQNNSFQFVTGVAYALK